MRNLQTSILFFLLFFTINVLLISGCVIQNKQNEFYHSTDNQSDRMIKITNETYCADLGDGFYLNPILKGDWGDPTVLRDGSDYYMTTHTATLSTPSMLIWHSKDLINWDPISYALHQDLGGAVWAADFVKHNDMFYMYLPVPSKGTNYVISAPHPSGPWSNPVDLKVSGIDPGHIATPEGKRYLHLDDGYIVELSNDGLSVKTEKTKVYEGWNYPNDWIVECFCLESPKLILRDEWYYLTVAQGGTAGPPTGHMVVSARSRTPYGPWENSPYNPVVKTKTRNEKWASMGHGTLISTPYDEWYIVFHAFEKGARHMGRQILMLPIEWTEDGWFRIPKAVDPAKPIKKPKGGVAVENKMKLSDNFSSNTLGLQWKMFGAAIGERVSVQNNVLVIQGQGVNPAESNPVVIDPMDNYYQVEVGLSVDKRTRCGLIFYSNQKKYLGLELDESGVYRLSGFGYSREKIFEAKKIDNVRFRLSNDHNDLLYWYSLDGGMNWERIDFVNNLTDWAGGSSIRPGIYSTGRGKAYFSDFKYQSIK